MFSILSRRCPLLATSCPSFFCLLSMLISDSRFDLVWFRLSCDHGWIRSESVNVRKQQQQQQLYHVQRKRHIVLNDAGVHLFDGRLVVSRGVNGSSLSATRLPPSVLHDGLTPEYGSPPAPLPPSSVENVVHSPPSAFQPTSAGVVPPPSHQ